VKSAYIDRVIRDSLFNKAYEDAHALVARAEADPSSSEEYKLELRRMLEDLERLRMKNIVKGVSVQVLEG